jgi:uncharacterized damage-inducible protein DinB
MPDQIIEPLFDYLYWRRDRCLGRAAELPPEAFISGADAASRDLRSTLVHELDVEWSWRIRLQGRPPEDWAEDKTLLPEDYPTVEGLRVHWDRDEVEMRAWIAQLSDDDLDRPVGTSDAGGRPLRTYLLHILMHGGQSFSEAGVLLAAAGQSVGDVDYLDFLDERARAGA